MEHGVWQRRRFGRALGGLALMVAGAGLVWLPFVAWGVVVQRDGVEAGFWMALFALVIAPLGLGGVAIGLLGVSVAVGSLRRARRPPG